MSHHHDEASRLDHANAHGSALDAKHSTFDYDEVDARLGHRHADDQHDEARQQTAAALRELAVWLVQGFLDDEHVGRTTSLKTVGLKAVALAWLVGEPRLSLMSSREIASKTDVSHTAIVRSCIALSRRFGISRRSQSSATKRRNHHER